MNKEITEGLDLMPPEFIDGLDVWSNQDGTPGSTTYDVVTSGTLVASDQDFGTCIEIIKDESPHKVRHTGETPFLPGCYLEVTARVKLLSGPIPQVRVSCYAGDAIGNSLGGSVDTTGPSVTLDTVGRIYTVRAIIGSGDRTGVDMVWGTQPVFGHMGVEIIGDNGSVVRIESIEVRDQTSIFHRELMDWIDVRDYGAIGDGITDDAQAFETADAAADGRDLVIPEGTYFLGKNVTILSRIRFEGTIVQATSHRLILRANFDYPTYVDAFGNETTALEKALQALFNFADHESLDLGGRRIQLDGPVVIKDVVPNLNTFTSRRVIRNGQLSAVDNANWDPNIVTETATYTPSNDSHELTNVTNIGSIEVGSLVEGFGVGREIYVVSKDEGANTLRVSQQLGRAQPSQQYTFTRGRYLLDFGEVTRVSNFNIDDVEFLCERRADALMLPDDGSIWSIRDCRFYHPRQHAITSPGSACQGITIDRNQFVAGEGSELVQDRITVGVNINNNDAKVRDNRCAQFRHFAVFHGAGNIVTGNHFWQLDDDDEGERTAGLVFTRETPKTTITGNYIDSMSIEHTNEIRVGTNPAPRAAGFGKLTITGNVFTATQVPAWFSFIKIKPTGTGHPLVGLTVVGNTFKNFSGAFIDKVEQVDTTLGDIDHTATTNLAFHSNSFELINFPTCSPVRVEHTQVSAINSWAVSFADKLPFGGQALSVESVVPIGEIQDAGNSAIHNFPYALIAQGAAGQEISLNWGANVSGMVQVGARSDLPA